MSDVLDDLLDVINSAPHNEVRPTICNIDYTILLRAVTEIERLRALVGAAAVGPTFAELTKDLSRRSREDDGKEASKNG